MIKVLLKNILPTSFWKYLQTFRKDFGQRQYRRWAKQNCVAIDDYLERLDVQIHAQMKTFARAFYASSLNDNIPADFAKEQLAGGGAYPLLYFIVKKYKPLVVIETGVAFGHSSKAFLTAMAENREGRLYSSDLPYKGIPNSREIIGLLVDTDLKQQWELCTSGDDICVPQILSSLEGKVDIFHYDSDKRYQAREDTLSKVRPRLKDNALIIFDDIQDNFHFRDLVVKHNLKYLVCEFEGKFVGITSFGNPHLLENARL